jgi:predicted ribosome quality control (RQC) complex YloA/Tae2 family protein
LSFSKTVHNNYYFLRQLSSSLDNIVRGTVISECYSQSKDEVIFRFETHGKSFYIRANLGSALSMLSFPPSIERARKNSIDLFAAVVGYRVKAIKQFKNERSFALELEENKTLLFKMHGNRSNVILFQDSLVIELFKKNIPPDSLIDLSKLDREIDWTFDAFLAFRDEPDKLYFTFGKIVWLFLHENGFNHLPEKEKWGMIHDVRQQLEQPSYYLTTVKNTIHLTLLPFANSRTIEGSPPEISNRFFFAFTQEFVFEKEKNAALGILRNRLTSGRNYCEKNYQKLQEIEKDSSYKHWADLIMAHMHDIRQGMESVILKDFYQDGHPVEIRLKKELPPQANAAIFYRKAKNQHIEIEKLQQSIRLKEAEIERNKALIQTIEEIDDLKELRKKIQQVGINPEKEKQGQSLPYHEFVVNGYRIWVGKNAEHNDELTLKYAYKEDLWLHAKDVPGSHVIIKYQSGKKFPKDVIERAGQLAAYNSKRKTETLCPVVVTPKKFVRKRKGDPAGAVIVEREEVILVEPRL